MGSTARVSFPPVPPPVRPVPAMTPVTTLVVSRFSVTLPVVPPPMRSVPAVTPVMVPPDSGEGLPRCEVDRAVGVEGEAGLGCSGAGGRGKQVERGGRRSGVVAGHLACHSKRGFTTVLLDELYAEV